MDEHRRGQLLDGRYRIEDTLGEGGMGFVVRARHVELDQMVAIKLMRRGVNPVWGQRFLREARAASRIESEHVARVFDIGRLEDGTPYMVMELLEGRDLGVILEEDGPLSTEEAIEVTRQACRALAAAHALGVVHRDVKPENLFLTERADGSPCIKLLDFGVSKEATIASEAPAPLTNTQTVLGSPQFMSPEQLVNCREVDHRADLWSLGATLFELLTLEHAFPADTIAELYTKILRDQPQRLRDLLPEAPSGLEDVILRCLDKERDRRFPDATALEAALAHVARAGEGTDRFAVRDTLPAIGRVALADVTTEVIAEVGVEVSADDDEIGVGFGELTFSDEHTPAATVRPVVHGSLPPPAPKAPWGLGVGIALGVMGLVMATVSAARLSPDASQALSPAIPVVLAPAALDAPAPEPPRDGEQASDPQRFMDSVPLPDAVRAELEQRLAKGSEDLEGGDLAAASAGARDALEILDAHGIRPNEAVSSVGAQAALLLGHVEADELREMLQAPMTRRHEGEKHLARLDRQMALVRAAYARVRSWNVNSFYRCAVVETASLDLAMGRLFADAIDHAHYGDRSWFIKAAAARLRNARIEFRHALDMRTETMLCVDEARAGHRAAKQAIASLPKIP